MVIGPVVEPLGTVALSCVEERNVTFAAAVGGTVRISGRVLGGYVRSGEKLLRLRIGVAGVKETFGIADVRPGGRFHTSFKFSPGNGVVRYWFSVSTLRVANYPVAPASSRRVTVAVGPG